MMAEAPVRGVFVGFICVGFCGKYAALIIFKNGGYALTHFVAYVFPGVRVHAYIFATVRYRDPFVPEIDATHAFNGRVEVQDCCDELGVSGKVGDRLSIYVA